MNRKWWIAAVLAAIAVAIGLFFLLRPRGPGGLPVAGPVKKPRLPVSMPTTFPDARQWPSRSTYIDKHGRMFSIYDTDGDGLYDADEIARYGTLRYDAHSRMNAREFRLVQGAPDRRWYEMARRSLSLREDSVGDGIPDEWKLRYFGAVNTAAMRPTLSRPAGGPNVAANTAATAPGGELGGGPATQDTPKQIERSDDPRGTAPLGGKLGGATQPFAAMTREGDRHRFREDNGAKSEPVPPTPKCGRNDDASGDGFPNIVKFYLNMDPTKINLLDPAMKPAKLEELPPPASPWSIRWDIYSEEFWEKQGGALERAKAGAPVAETSWQGFRPAQGANAPHTGPTGHPPKGGGVFNPSPSGRG